MIPESLFCVGPFFLSSHPEHCLLVSTVVVVAIVIFIIFLFAYLWPWRSGEEKEGGGKE